MKFRIECADDQGKERQGTVKAESVEAAIATVKAKGFTLTSIAPVTDAVPPQQPAPAEPVAAIPASPKPVSTTPLATPHAVPASSYDAENRPTPGTVAYAAALSKEDRGNWPITLSIVFGLVMFSGCIGPLGLPIAVFLIASMVRSDWRKTCFEFVHLDETTTSVQQFVLLGTPAFFFLLMSTVGPSDSRFDVPMDSSSEIANEESVSPPETKSQVATSPTSTIQAQPESFALDSEPAKEWWSVGTLQGKTADDWKVALPEDKLATCAGLIAVMWNDHPLHTTILNDRRRSEITPDEIRPYARELVVFIDKTFVNNADPNQKVAKTAAIGMAELNWTRSTSDVLAEKLKKQLSNAGLDNVSIEINEYVDDSQQKIVLVCWEIGDNLTKGMVHGGAQIDIVEILKAARESEMEIREVTVFGSFKMVDKFGNVSKMPVVRAIYLGDTLRKINFDNFLFQNVYEVSENSFLHPGF